MLFQLRPRLVDFRNIFGTVLDFRCSPAVTQYWNPRAASFPSFKFKPKPTGNHGFDMFWPRIVPTRTKTYRKPWFWSKKNLTPTNICRKGWFWSQNAWWASGTDRSFRPSLGSRFAFRFVPRSQASRAPCCRASYERHRAVTEWDEAHNSRF